MQVYLFEEGDLTNIQGDSFFEQAAATRVSLVIFSQHSSSCTASSNKPSTSLRRANVTRARSSMSQLMTGDAFAIHGFILPRDRAT